MKITGFDWDNGNWPKCGKHGVSREEIEQVLLGEPAVMADPSPDEASPAGHRENPGWTLSLSGIHAAGDRRADQVAAHQRMLHASEGSGLL